MAIKVLPAAFSADADRLTRFEQEARAAGALNHPNVLAVYDVGTDNGVPYIVAELLDGEPLRAKLGRPIAHRKALDYAAQIARGLAAAHERGIVHRDLKPENVLVTADGRAKIVDFGLAKLALPEEPETAPDLVTRPAGTDPGVVLGTVGYMAPEQVRGQKVDHRADIFSFGCILYEMLAGRKAFWKASGIETLNAILAEDPPELAASNPAPAPALQRLIVRCLEKNPAARFQSASDLAFALDAFVVELRHQRVRRDDRARGVADGIRVAQAAPVAGRSDRRCGRGGSVRVVSGAWFVAAGTPRAVSGPRARRRQVSVDTRHLLGHITRRAETRPRHHQPRSHATVRTRTGYS